MALTVGTPNILKQNTVTNVHNEFTHRSGRLFLPDSEFTAGMELQFYIIRILLVTLNLHVYLLILTIKSEVTFFSK